MADATSYRLAQLKAMLRDAAKAPDFTVRVTPVSVSQLAAFGDGLLPDDHFRLLAEVGEICVGHLGSLVIDSYIPCPLSQSPFYEFSPAQCEKNVTLWIYAHDVDGLCHGYDIRSTLLKSCSWDFHYCTPYAEEAPSGLDLIEWMLLENFAKIGATRL
jgi:hypothetical protein